MKTVHFYAIMPTWTPYVPELGFRTIVFLN